ncbi:MAG: DUF2461 family protein [Fimbriimonadaceae bacterium]
MTTAAHFSPDTSEFLRELELNNNRPWFETSKKRFEAAVVEPMEALAAVMIARMKELEPAIQMQPRDAITKIHRDIRLNKDKSPYWTSVEITVGPPSRPALVAPALGFRVGPRDVRITSGYRVLESDKVRVIRNFLATHLDEFETELARPDFVKYFGEMRGDRSKMLAPELTVAARRQPLLFNNQFCYWADHDTKTALRDDLPEFLMAHARAAQPMNKFLTRAF